MSLKIYNTLTRSLEVFDPIQSPKVKMYVCGPTVYGLLHVGNFRGPVFYNFVRNWLEHIGYEVEFALNFTDVDDKIIHRAQQEGKDSKELAENYIREYQEDFSSLGLRKHEHNPRVTESMDEIILMIQQLIEKKKAYVVDGDVFFSIESFQDYGKLSGRHVDELQAGARVEIDTKKQNPMDFTLWKSAKPDEPSWSSPWGQGRPGWHIECSAMTRQIFGDQIDIHGGGSDLIFPHHENEIAQSEACSEKIFSRYWIHVGMLNFGGQKMSKSLGNLTTLRDFLAKNHPEVYKWMILSVHYRTIADFNEEAVERAVSALARIYSALALLEDILKEDKIFSTASLSLDEAFQDMMKESWEKITTVMNEDFGTPQVMAVLFDLVRMVNGQWKRGMKVTAIVHEKARIVHQLFLKMGSMMSLFQEPAKGFLTHLDDLLLQKMNLNRSEVDRLVAERSAARANKDFKKSDELREQLTRMNISVMDMPQGTFWEVTK